MLLHKLAIFRHVAFENEFLYCAERWVVATLPGVDHSFDGDRAQQREQQEGMDEEQPEQQIPGHLFWQNNRNARHLEDMVANFCSVLLLTIATNRHQRYTSSCKECYS